MTPMETEERRRRRAQHGGTGLHDLFIVVFGVAFLASLGMNVLHMTMGSDEQQPTAFHQAMLEFTAFDSSETKTKNEKKNREGPVQDENVRSGHLKCDAFGGPSQELAQEMVYWKDIPEDASWISPFKDPLETKYLTFEPDGGGWNNIRMAMETIFGLALAMGRTLVIPPEKSMYLLGKQDNKQKKHFSFIDFYPIEDIAVEYVGLNIINMKEYLETEAMKGKLRNKITGDVEYPPGNRTDWDGIDQHDYDILRAYLRNVTFTPETWKPSDCLPAFPTSGDHKDVAMLQDLVQQAKERTELGDPVPVDSDTLPRLEEALAGRHKLCVYDEEMQKAPTVHFQMNSKKHLRLLVHFYGFLFFENWREDLLMKRFIRDHVRYIDQIQCAAARIVAKIRKRARKRDPSGNPDGFFDSFHIRRGDFQFKDTRVEAVEIYENSKEELTPNSTIFIATDERNKKFFEPLRKQYDILFLDDFPAELKGLNTNYFGMVDQLVSSRGRIFFGCWHSTFTGFIMRIRGYHSQNEKAPGYQEGILPNSYYYATKVRKLEMHRYAPLRNGFFNREFPMSWREIDKGIGMLQSL